MKSPFFIALLLCFTIPSAEVEAETAADHWAWKPLVKPRGARSIDEFILLRLYEKDLALSPEVDRRTLIRRLSFDLHGLPPVAKEVQDFVDDPDPKAYEKLVDRFLASPHYGERFAQHWLDLAHYADTHGFERDRRRPHAWRYRDYVIDSFNQDKPYDRFLQEQIAGDILWPESQEAVIATGFLAAGPWDFVGQVETKSPILRRSARSLDLDDMATQVMTSTMATTINCARCHDHKLDPILQKEYYQLRAIFAGVKRGERAVPSGEVVDLEAKRNGLLAEMQRLRPGLDLADMVGGGDGTGSGKAGQGLDPRTGKSESKKMGYLSKVVPNQFAKVEHRFIDGVFIPKAEGGKAVTPISSTGMTATTDLPADAKAWDLIRNGPLNSQHSAELGGIRFGPSGESLLGLHANAGITFDLAELRKALGEAVLQFSAQVGYFGHLNAGAFADVRVLLDGEVVVEHRKLKRADGSKEIELKISPKARFLTLLSTDGGNSISMDQVGFGNPRLSVATKRSARQQARLKALQKELLELNRTISALQDPKVFAVVPQQKPPEIRVLERGDPESPTGEPLSAGAIALLPMVKFECEEDATSEGARRAALARWITDPKNPLTARVIVNRLWHWHFGQGLVVTPSDFGRGGGRPSHPELLDWLALELQDQNWSLKALHRLILTSATYKQSSRFLDRAEEAKIDGDNRLLWRQNSRRIEAEAVRDAVLAVSGKLNRSRGGPGFEDFNYREAYAPEYTYLTPDRPALWRRAIYRYRVRTTPNRFLTTLDCPDPANFTPVRLATTTPLQSLALYNNEFMLQQARSFAERLESEAGPTNLDQVKRGFELALGRPPSPTEASLAAEFVKAEGLFAYCRALYNANEFVYVD